MDSYNGKLITMYADTYKPDPVTQAKIDEWDNKVKKITDEVVAHSPEVLTRSYGESAPTGNLITDALMATVLAPTHPSIMLAASVPNCLR